MSCAQLTTAGGVGVRTEAHLRQAVRVAPAAAVAHPLLVRLGRRREVAQLRRPAAALARLPSQRGPLARAPQPRGGRHLGVDVKVIKGRYLFERARKQL